MQFNRLSYEVIDFLCRRDIGGDSCGRATQVARRLLKSFRPTVQLRRGARRRLQAPGPLQARFPKRRQ